MQDHSIDLGRIRCFRLTGVISERYLWYCGYPDISVKDTLVMDVLVTDISVTGHFGHMTFR